MGGGHVALLHRCGHALDMLSDFLLAERAGGRVGIGLDSFVGRSLLPAFLAMGAGQRLVQNC